MNGALLLSREQNSLGRNEGLITETATQACEGPMLLFQESDRRSCQLGLSFCQSSSFSQRQWYVVGHHGAEEGKRLTFTNAEAPFECIVSIHYQC
jgi:hypothetical protein